VRHISLLGTVSKFRIVAITWVADIRTTVRTKCVHTRYIHDNLRAKFHMPCSASVITIKPRAKMSTFLNYQPQKYSLNKSQANYHTSLEGPKESCAGVTPTSHVRATVTLYHMHVVGRSTTWGVTSNGMKFVSSFMKICRLVHELKWVQNHTIMLISKGSLLASKVKD